MNTNFVNIIKRIVAEQGDDILANPQRLKGYVADYAAAESKAERLAFSKCIEAGAYNELKDAPDAAARQAVKAALAQRVHSSEGLDLALCNDALDALEAGMIEVKPLCQKCGKELQEGWKMCPFCGEAQPASVPVPESAPEVAVPEVPVTPSQETAAAVETPLVVETPPPMSTAAQTAAASPAAAQMQTKQTKSHASSAKKHIRRNILIAAGVVGVLVIGIGIWIWYQQQPNVTAADLPSLCEGWTVSNTQAEIYYSETTAKTNVNGEDIEYWLYNTYKNDGGSGERLLQIIFNELRNAGLVLC
ncbi:MAG: hypothetical protein Pg6A_17710 [Termitinemataceae bacterium]|nr:MAG: hypothetical protein Pg6A_17710 [Termitinemataceae bacterium]